MQELFEHEDSDSPDAVRAQSLFHNGVSPFSPIKHSEFMPSEEETSNIFKSLHMKIIKCQDLENSKTNFNSEATPEKDKDSKVSQLSYQMSALTKVFLQYQESIKTLSQEVQHLNTKVVQLKDNMDMYSENGLQSKSKCKCSIF